ncbi:MAG: hypothetical protein HYX68_15020 [Planctomycetes bacterium]|nr:hypothetical protein [Planctomycetota bacterium]
MRALDRRAMIWVRRLGELGERISRDFSIFGPCHSTKPWQPGIVFLLAFAFAARDNPLLDFPCAGFLPPQPLMENALSSPDVTTLLRLMREGPETQKRDAADQLFRLVHDRLHDLAEMYLHKEGRANPLLQPTLLVTDVFQKLVGGKKIGPSDRKEFFAFARRAIPQILIDYHRQFASRAGKAPHISLNGAGDVAESSSSLDLAAFQDVLNELETLDPDQHRVVVDRFCLGRTLQEIADEMERPLIFVRRKWNAARVWLHRRLTK